MRIRSLILPTAAAILVAVIALSLAHSRGGSGSAAATSPTSAKNPHLRIVNYAFAPTALIVKAGTTITVTNSDGTAHTVTARSGAFDSGTLSAGQTGRLTLKTPGTYTYFCQFHAFMSGTIKVTG